jgi:hypothetical protein
VTDDNLRHIWSDAQLDAALADLHDDVGDDSGLTFARASLLTAAGAEPGEAPEPHRSGSWRWIAAAAAVVVLTGGVVVAGVVTDRDPVPVAPATPAPGLDQLRGVDLPIRPGQFRHATTSSWSVATRDTDRGPTSYVGTQTEVWIPADPAGEWRRRSWTTDTPAGLPVPVPRLDPLPVNTIDESGPGGAFPSAEAHSRYLGKNFRGSWDTPTAPFVAALPADVQWLRDRLADDQSSMGDSHPGAPAGPGVALQMVRRVLEPGLVRGDVRVALWKALARVPGIVLVPRAAAPDGRGGIGFKVQDTGDTLIADPGTAQLIGYTLSPKFPADGQEPRNTAELPVSSPPGTTAPPRPTEKIHSVEAIYHYTVTDAGK